MLCNIPTLAVGFTFKCFYVEVNTLFILSKYFYWLLHVFTLVSYGLKSLAFQNYRSNFSWKLSFNLHWQPVAPTKLAFWRTFCLNLLLSLFTCHFIFLFKIISLPYFTVALYMISIFYLRSSIMPEVPSFYRGHKVPTWGVYFYYKGLFHLLIHKYYCKSVSIHTYFSHYILCVLFGSLLSAIVHLLLQINVRKKMHTALFCVICALPVFIISYKFNYLGSGS